MRGAYDSVRALVLGAGASGQSAARLLLARGGSVCVVDEGVPGQAIVDALRAAGATLRTGTAGLPREPFDLCVVSPGFMYGHRWLTACRERAIPLISELELGAVYWPGKCLAVTGSKGKSSLVKLCAETLGAAGLRAVPGGNYGTPFSQLALESADAPWAVVEVSSFQMELTRTMAPDIAILLNLQPDHLDRHADMDEYRRLKLKLFARMRKGALALLPEGFDAGMAIPSGVEVRRFGVGDASDWRYAPRKIRCARAQAEADFDLSGSWFDNQVLGPAAAAAAAALSRAGVARRALEQGLQRFEALPHRMQPVARRADGVRFVDDSKATSLAAMAAALEMAGGPVRLIAGGVLKEPVTKSLKELLTRTAKKVYLIGQCAEQMLNAWGDSLPCELCGTLERAVLLAAREAKAGETVLLSPGTASFDQFNSYRERGERFVELARAVAGPAECFFPEGEKNKEG